MGTALTMHARYLKRSYASFVCSKPVPEGLDSSKAGTDDGSSTKANSSKVTPFKAAVYNILVFKAAEDTVGSLAGDSMAAVAAHFGAASPYAFAPRPRVLDDSPAPAVDKISKKKAKSAPKLSAAGSTPAAPKLPQPAKAPAAVTDAARVPTSVAAVGGHDAVKGVPLRALRASVLTASEALRLGRFPDSEVAKVEAACGPIRGDMAPSMRATVQRLVAVTRCLSLDQDPQSVAGGVKELLTRIYGSTWHVLSGTTDAHAGVAAHLAPKPGSPYYVGGLSGAVTAAAGELLVLHSAPVRAQRAEEAWSHDRAMQDALWADQQPWTASSAEGVEGGDSKPPVPDLPVPADLSTIEMAQNEVLYVFRPVPPSKSDVQAVKAGNSWGVGRAVVTALAFGCMVLFCAVHALADTRCSAENTFVGVNSRFGYEVYVPDEQGGYVGGEWIPGWYPGADMLKPVNGGSTAKLAKGAADDMDSSFEALEVGQDGSVLSAEHDAKQNSGKVGGATGDDLSDSPAQATEGGAPPQPADKVVATRAVVTCRPGAVRSATGWTRLGRYCLLFAGGLFMIGPVMRAMGKQA